MTDDRAPTTPLTPADHDALRQPEPPVCDCERLKAEIARLAVETPSQTCRRRGWQRCSFCEDLTCGDNTSPAKAEIERLRGAIEQILNYEPGYKEVPPDFNAGCRDCAHARYNNWPPSGLCIIHFAVIDDLQVANGRTYAAQHERLREIARAALAGKDKP